MKVLLTFCMILSCTAAICQDVDGAWQSKEANETTEKIILLVDGYFSCTEFDKNNRAFIETFGGPYTLNGNEISFLYEFHSSKKDFVGKHATIAFTLSDELKTTFDGQNRTWKRIDSNENPIAGVWWISERKQGNEMVKRELNDRRTLKILTGTRFQWVAINIKTGDFSGTGGGTFSFGDGQYEEHIQFFSRDGSRVGSSLNFEGELQEGKWHHSGLSSKGEPIYEVWSRLSEQRR